MNNSSLAALGNYLELFLSQSLKQFFHLVKTYLKKTQKFMKFNVKSTQMGWNLGPPLQYIRKNVLSILHIAGSNSCVEINTILKVWSLEIINSLSVLVSNLTFSWVIHFKIRPFWRKSRTTKFHWISETYSKPINI